MLTVGVAAWVAYVGQESAKTAANSGVQQAVQSQLSTAITALGSDQPAQRMAGLVLLRRNAADQVEAPLPISRAKQKAYSTYIMALDVLGTYIHMNSPAFSSAQSSAVHSIFGLGHGIPAHNQVPLDVLKAASQMQLLLDMQSSVRQSSVRSLHPGTSPAIDLANDELYGVNWRGIKFDWLSGVFLKGIDLRAADLEGSRWGGLAYLRNSHLQCAYLPNADLRGSDLTDANLSGANVNGADFRGAKLRGAKLTGVVGTAKGLPPGLPLSSWNQQTCAANQAYWDNLPSITTP
jgi:hypothetical protein